MSTSPLGRRTSFSLYAETQEKLRSLETGLKRHGLAVDRTDIIRALVHATPETDIMALGILRDTYERGPAGPALGSVAEFAPVRMHPADFDKLERAAERLHQAGIKASLGVLVRALVMQAPTLEKLTAMVHSLQQDIPDGRALRWQSR